MSKIKPPSYIINPVAITQSFWTPEIFQYVIGRGNSSYLNSVWLGTGWQILALPYRAFYEILVPLFNFRFVTALVSMLVIPVSMLMIFLHSLFGQIKAVNLPVGVVTDAHMLTPEQGHAAIKNGFTAPVIELASFVYGDSPR